MRLTPEIRKTELMDYAITLAQDVTTGYYGVKREQLAALAGVSPALVNHYFGNVAQLRRHIMRRAIHIRNVAIVAQGLLRNDPLAIKACMTTPELRAGVDEYLRGI